MVSEGHTPIEQLAFFAEYVGVADWAWQAVCTWEPLARDTVGKQLVRAADSVGANLVEGDGRYSRADGLHFFIIARASARETKYWIGRARERGLVSSDEANAQITSLENATRKLNALISYRRGKADSPMIREIASEYDPAPNTEYLTPSEDL